MKPFFRGVIGTVCHCLFSSFGQECPDHSSEASSAKERSPCKEAIADGAWFVDRLPEKGIPSVSLRRLVPEGQFLGCKDWEVSGCCDDHRRLEPGQLFVAVAGARPGYDGHRFVREALDRGAAGVVLERPCALAGRLQVVVPDTRAAYARICQALSGEEPVAGHLELVAEGQEFEVRIVTARPPPLWAKSFPA